jgi:alpha-tubulin suppressor-like RCC1 family protein
LFGRHHRARAFLAPLTIAMMLAACNQIFGIDERTVSSSSEGDAGSSADSSSKSDGGGDDALGIDGGSDGSAGCSASCSGATPICSGGNKCVGVSSVAFGPADGHACAVLTDGTVRCWGETDHGRLGDVNVAKTGPSAPVMPLDLDQVTSITLGARHTCAIREKEVWCWGSNESGQVNGTPGPSILTPTKLALPAGITSQVKRVSAGHQHTCAASEAGDVICWGRNAEGQLGAGDFSERPGFHLVSGFTAATSLCSGLVHSCAASPTKVVCWGDRTQVKLGNAMVTGAGVGPVKYFVTPVGMPDIPNVESLTCGTNHTCALDTAGSGICWGANESGQLGLGHTNPTDYALKPNAFVGSVHVAVGDSFTCVIRADNQQIKCVGRNEQGQLGDTTFTTRSTLADATGVGTGAMLGVSRRHACALRGANGNGGLRCWGDNTQGQLGRPTIEPRSAVGESPTF